MKDLKERYAAMIYRDNSQTSPTHPLSFSSPSFYPPLFIFPSSWHFKHRDA